MFQSMILLMDGMGMGGVLVLGRFTALQPSQNGAQTGENAHTYGDERPEANSQPEVNTRASSIRRSRRRRALGCGARTRRMGGCRCLDARASACGRSWRTSTRTGGGPVHRDGRLSGVDH